LALEIARGTFAVSLQPLQFEGADDRSGLSRMTISKELQGDLIATTCGQMLSATTPVQGSAGYVALERVEGSLKGKKGSFVLQHTAIMDRGDPSLSVLVVPDSGTGELTGLAGRFDIRVEAGVHSYEFEYSLPE
jgi:hypothetical protein